MTSPKLPFINLFLFEDNGLVLIGGSSFGDSETPATKIMSEKSMRMPNAKFCDLDPYPTDGYYRSRYETNHYLNGHASVVSPTGIVTCGGKLGSRRIPGSKICKRLSSSGRWVDFPPLLNDRKHFRMKMMNGKIWAIGGWDQQGRYGFQHTMEYIDAKNLTKWEQKEIPFGVHSHCVAELPNNRLLVIGGMQHYERNHRLYEKSEFEELYGDVGYEGYFVSV